MNDAEESRARESEPASPPVPRHPPLPRPRRLDRNKLTIAAVAMGTLVLGAVVFVQPGRGGRDDKSGAGQRTASATPATSTYLDRPVRLDTAPTAPRRIQPPSTDSVSLGDVIAQAEAQSRALADSRNGSTSASGAALRSTVPPAASAVAASGAVAPPSSADAAAAGTTVPGGAWPSSRGADGSTYATAYDRALEASPIISGERVPASTPPIGMGAASAQPNTTIGNGTSHPSMTRASVIPSPGPYAIHAGTMIAGVLLTAVNSDAPGDILAQVSRDVYDSETESVVLIPKGSKLLGTYDHQIAIGQNRLVVAWTRLIFPDGRSLALAGLPGKDQEGATGMSDAVDNHYRRVFGSAALLSILGAGLQLSQPQQSTIFAPPSPGQIAAGSAGQELSRVATQLMQRNIDVRPTITIRQGMPFNVFLTTDLVFDGPYAQSRADATAFR